MADLLESVDAAAGTTTTYGIAVGQTLQGQIGSGGDHDWYRITLTAGQTYTFALVGTEVNDLLDPYLRLRNIGGTEVASDDDGGPGWNSTITFTATSSGTYYLDAAGYNPSYTGQYGLSITQGSRAHYDAAMGGGAVDADTSWSATPGSGTTVTFGFRASAPGYSVNGHPTTQSTFAQLTAQEIAAVRTVMQLWSDVSGVALSEVNPGGYTNSATVLFSNYTDPNDGAGAFAFYPGSTAATASAGDVYLNTSSVSTSSLPFGSYSFFAVMHEVGHALGLSHPGDYHAVPGTSITYANGAQFTEDSHQYSVMSYFDEANTGGNDGGYPDTPLLFDIYALQQIYGPNMSTRTGDTVYGFGSTAGSVYDFGVNSTPALCIWDAGGNDTLNSSGFGHNQTIDLNAGLFSDIGGLINNVAIAIGATIENAWGGSGADTVHGNGVANSLYGNGGSDQLFGHAGNDWLFGGAGNDSIDGGSGADIAGYAGVAAQYQTLVFNGSIVVAGGSDGIDLLQGVEQVSFANLTMAAFPSVYDYIASYGDLINVFGTNGQAGLDHFRFYGSAESRHVTFDGLDYVASYADLINTFGANDDAGAIHFIRYGFRESRLTTFNGLEYIASYGDLMNAFGANDDLGAVHFIQCGRFEGRHTTFNGLEYIASYRDLMNAFGANDDSGAVHFIQFGQYEGRQTTFDGWKYIASYGDLINAFGASEDAGTTHFIQNGFNEGRTVSFDPAAYLAHYGDLRVAFGNNLEAATVHYIVYGFYEGRDWP